MGQDALHHWRKKTLIRKLTSQEEHERENGLMPFVGLAGRSSTIFVKSAIIASLPSGGGAFLLFSLLDVQHITCTSQSYRKSKTLNESGHSLSLRLFFVKVVAS